MSGEWISVTERLPDEPTVLARDQFGYCCQMGFIGGKFRSLLTRVPQPKYQSSVTHWMPLPEPPTDAELSVVAHK